ncbi:UNVERIFIED_CONTAM: hypothetical protein PYX00_010521 [Menopon gallinae]|uniref:Orcokinin n=1 Tax=Menopon gallinae TaxID=328185 RepID=A0AAW2HFN5_9NEOP
MIKLLQRLLRNWSSTLMHPHYIGHFLRDVESLKSSSWYPQQRRYGKLGDSPGVQLFKANKRFDGMRYAADKRNFDEIDRSGFNGFIKRNFDEIDRSGFNSLVKKNFDEIDRHGFNSFVKRSANDLESSNH